MPKGIQPQEWDLPLFEMAGKDAAASEHRRALPREARLWTGNKARLIQGYLVNFIQVTRHGTYIDGFAGPHDPDHLETWAAGRVLGPEGPGLLRHFFLFERDKTKLRYLERLAAADLGRDVRIFEGDVNVRIDEVLHETAIPPREATFCLLDQYTIECRWDTVKRIAEYRAEAGYKIEIFYFLAQAWMNRVLKTRRTVRSTAELVAWWGNDDYGLLLDMPGSERAALLCARMRTELGYRHVHPYEIYKARGSNEVMYYMIHASDHPRASFLMQEAYEEVVMPPERLDQMDLGF